MIALGDIVAGKCKSWNAHRVLPFAKFHVDMEESSRFINVSCPCGVERLRLKMLTLTLTTPWVIIMRITRND